MAEWLPICDLFTFEKGTLQSSKCTPGPYTFITAAEDWKTHTEYTHDSEALIFAMAASGSLGRTHYFKGKFISSDLCFILAPKADKKLDLKFYYRVFNFLREDIVKKTATGTSKLAINQTNFGNYKLPYFGIEHQLAFSGKLDRISEIKNTLVTGFYEQTSFLSLLRQVILQEAVEGKLTAKWRKEHPALTSGENHASCLLKKIRAEKDRLIAEGKIKKEKFFTPIFDEENPFKLPEGWVWYRLGEIINVKSSKRIFAADYVKEGVPFYRSMEIGLLGANKAVLSPLYISRKKYQQIKENFGVPKLGDILLACIGGSIGNTWVVDEREFYYKDGNLVQLDSVDEVLTSFLLYYLKSPLFYRSALERVAGTSYDALTIIKINHSLFPLPPLAEQQTIVDIVGRLMSIIEELEKEVTVRKEQAEILIQSVLREAFMNN
jgi:type I restriction enzyme, S subunit